MILHADKHFNNLCQLIACNNLDIFEHWPLRKLLVILIKELGESEPIKFNDKILIESIKIFSLKKSLDQTSIAFM